MAHLKSLKKRYEKKWLALPTVKAVGIGFLENEETGLIISVEKDDDTLRNEIPSSMEGIGIEIQVSGPFEALN